jgi:hypothetical protein
MFHTLASSTSMQATWHFIRGRRIRQPVHGALQSPLSFPPPPHTPQISPTSPTSHGIPQGGPAAALAAVPEAHRVLYGPTTPPPLSPGAVECFAGVIRRCKLRCVVLCVAVREHGVRQFLEVFRRVKDRRGDVLKWGDEVGARAARLMRGATGPGKGGGCARRSSSTWWC